MSALLLANLGTFTTANCSGDGSCRRPPASATNDSLSAGPQQRRASHQVSRAGRTEPSRLPPEGMNNKEIAFKEQRAT